MGKVTNYGEIKYLRDADGESEALFNLDSDRAEVHDLSEEQPGALTAARSRVDDELDGLSLNRVPVLDGGDREALEALGYLEE